MTAAQHSLQPERPDDVDPRLSELIATAMTEHRVPGLAVGLIADGHQVLAGFGITSVENTLPVDANTIFVAGSITKMVVATTVMRLVDRQDLDLDVPIRNYLPDLKLADESVAAAVTMRNLLTHSAGWAGDDIDDRDYGPGDDALARAIASFGDRPQVIPLGSLWSYNNSAFWLAGRVIEVVTGMTLEAAITDLIYRPLVMTSSFFFESEVITRRVAVGHIVGEGDDLTIARPWSPPRSHRAAGGMLTTIADLIAFAQFHLGDGLAADGARVMSPSALHSMREPQRQGAGSEFAGLGWSIREVAGHRILSHAGDWNGQQALVTLVPERGIAIGSLANGAQARLVNDAIAAWALRQYLGLVDPKPVPIEHDDQRLDALVGRYALPGAAIDIQRRGNRLGITYVATARQATGNSGLPEQPAALTTAGQIIVLVGPFEGVSADFFLEPDGSVAWVRLGGRVYPRQT